MNLNIWPSLGVRQKSLRRRLLIWMGVVHVVVALGFAWFSYDSLNNVLTATKDDYMQMLATSYSESTTVPVMEHASRREIVSRGLYIVQIWSEDGRLLSSSWPDFQMPLQPDTGISVVSMGPRPTDQWRVYSSAAFKPNAAADLPVNTRIQVSLNADSIRRHALSRAVRSTLPIALLLPASFAVLWIIVWSSSRALRGVALEVAAQDERSLSEISPTRVPDEIAPLVDAYNSRLVSLRRSVEGQRRFIQDAAHELRTPTAAVAVQLENLRGLVPTGDATERFAQLEAGVKRSQHLIEQLLKLSRHENGENMSIDDSQRVDMAGLLRESFAQLMPVADRRHIDIGFEGRVDAILWAPVSALRSVFDNLIGNALNYTPEGGVVDVIMHKANGRPVVDILDNGPGIPTEYLGRAFDRFFRVPGTSASGSGLGLAIARSAAERHGLQIELKNRPGNAGLLARVYLPGPAQVPATVDVSAERKPLARVLSSLLTQR